MNQNIAYSYNKNSKNSNKRKKRLFPKKLLFFSILIVVFILLFSNKLNIAPDSTHPTSTVPTEKQKDITINMTVVGDIMCHSTNFKAAYNSSLKTYDFSDVFSEISPYISNADISIGNLETTFAGEDRGYSGYPTFNSPSALGQDLANLGFDILCTANNHSLDKGYSGLVNTLDELDKTGLAYMGTYRSEEEQNTILIKDVNGIKIAFLAFTYGTNGIPVPKGKEYCVNLIDKTLIKNQISKAQELDPDIICVNMHWGYEYKTKQNSEQEDLADFLFENGADIILGSHPHVLQPMEKRTISMPDGSSKDGFVIYSLGNFMSGQVITETRNSIILNLVITKKADNTISIDSYNYIPIYMQDRDTSGTNRYKIIDIETTLSDYDEGKNNISSAFYKTLSSSLDKIKSIMD